MIPAQHYGRQKNPNRQRFKYTELADYRAWLMAEQISPTYLVRHLRGVEEYKKSGKPFEEPYISEWESKLRASRKTKGKKDSTVSPMIQGVKNYARFMAGEPYEWVYPNRHKTIPICNDDCFNCIYPDCIKPDAECY